MGRNNDLQLCAVDARIDQEASALLDVIRGDVDGWQILQRKMRTSQGGFTDDEVLLLMRLANFASGVLTGRLLGRKV
jgi:hypothetical protein